MFTNYHEHEDNMNNIRRSFIEASEINRQNIFKKNSFDTIIIIGIYFPLIALDIYFSQVSNSSCDAKFIHMSDYLLVCACVNLLWSIYNIYLIWQYNSPIEIYELDYVLINHTVYHLFYTIWICVGMFLLSNAVENECNNMLLNYLFAKIVLCLMDFLRRFIAEVFK